MTTPRWLSQITPRLPRFSWWLWVALLVTIPVTSSPLMGKLAGGGTVAPLAGAPLLLLGLLWFFPRTLRGAPLPRLALPALVFLLVAALATVGAAFLGVLPDLGIGVGGRELRAFVSLCVGLGFYLTAATLPSSCQQTRRSLAWLYLGGVLMLTWSSVQAYFVLRGQPFPEAIKELHVVISVRPLLADRVTGMAFEPSWLADLLMILYLPLWTSSVVGGFSAFKLRVGKLSVELVLLIWGAAVLYLSLSRVGLASALLVIAGITLWTLNRYSRRWAEGIITRLGLWSGSRRPVSRAGLRIVMLAMTIALLIAVAWGLVAGAAALNSRIGRLFETDILQTARESTNPVFAVANRLAYAERVVYWDAGLRIFTRYPILGAGLGNTGFLFRENVHTYGHKLPEIVQLINGDPRLANPKNLWVRLLAETGLAGALVFLSWLLVMGAAAWKLVRQGRPMAITIGTAGLLALMAQIAEGFSLDSFALPQLWIMMGLVTAATQVFSTQEDNSPSA